MRENLNFTNINPEQGSEQEKLLLECLRLLLLTTKFVGLDIVDMTAHQAKVKKELDDAGSLKELKTVAKRYQIPWPTDEKISERFKISLSLLRVKGKKPN